MFILRGMIIGEYWVFTIFPGGDVYSGGYVYYFLGILPGGMFIPEGTPIRNFRVSGIEIRTFS